MARAPISIGLSPQAVTLPAPPATTYDVTFSEAILEGGMSRLFIKQNDTNPAIECTLQDSDGTAVNLSGATARFLMRARGGATVKVNAAAAITNAAGGVVQYTPVAADTDTPGQYEAEIEVTYSDSTRETFPSRGYISIVIQDDIA
jgi:Rib/alpha/Esp surface antigen-like repeat protein